MNKKNEGLLDSFKSKDEEYELEQDTMSLEDYLQLVKKEPKVARTSYQRLYDMILSHGITKSGKVGQENLPRYKLFDDPFSNGKDAIYGIENNLAEFVKFINAAAKGYEKRKRFMLLFGPVASSKSTMANLLKKGLEVYSRTDEGKLYSFEWTDLPLTKQEIEGNLENTLPCPLNEDPLFLLPTKVREEFISKINENINENSKKIRIEGEIDPVCKHIYKRLMKEHNGDWTKVLKEHVNVRRFIIDEKNRNGIGTFKPKDEKNQDSTELTGDVQYSKLAIYGSESHPLAFSNTGEFQLANRGVLEMVEVLKLGQEFLYELLDATQDRKIKGKNQPNTSVDCLMFGHTNPFEYHLMMQNDGLEALRDRKNVVLVPYNLELSEETRIFEKFYKNDGTIDKHIAPHTNEILAMWSILTRLKEPNDAHISLIQKLKLYDGQHLDGKTIEDVKELIQEGQEDLNDIEGFSGISPRFGQNVMDSLLTDLEIKGNCINPSHVITGIGKELMVSTAIKSNERKEYFLDLISIVEEQYEKIAEKDLMLAVCSDSGLKERLFRKYRDNVVAFNSDRKVKDSQTGASYNPDEKFMHEIEEKMGIGDETREAHRLKFINYVNDPELRYNFEKDPKISRALDEVIYENHKTDLNLSAWVTGQSQEDLEKLDIIKKSLKSDMGYCDECASKLIEYGGKKI